MIAIHDVTLINFEDATKEHSQTILVDGDIISGIVPSDEFVAGSATDIHDAKRNAAMAGGLVV